MYERQPYNRSFLEYEYSWDSFIEDERIRVLLCPVLLEEKEGASSYVPSFHPLRLDWSGQSAQTLGRAVTHSRVPVVLAGSEGVFQ